MEGMVFRETAKKVRDAGKKLNKNMCSAEASLEPDLQRVLKCEWYHGAVPAKARLSDPCVSQSLAVSGP